MYNTVVFDLDGTILDTLEDLTDSVNYILHKYGFELRSIGEIRHFAGNGLYNLISRALPENIPQKTIDEIYPEFLQHYNCNCNIKTKPYCGIVKAVADLNSMGYKTAIVSNKSDTAVKELSNVFFKGLMAVSLGVREGVKRKPEPDLVFEAVKFMNGELKNTLYIGDSEVDKKTADNAGIDCILVSWGFRNREELLKLKPKGIIDDAEEIFKYLKQNAV